MEGLYAHTTEQFSKIDVRFDKMDQRFDTLEAQVDRNAEAIERNAQAIDRNANMIQGLQGAIDHLSLNYTKIEAHIALKEGVTEIAEHVGLELDLSAA